MSRIVSVACLSTAVAFALLASQSASRAADNDAAIGRTITLETGWRYRIGTLGGEEAVAYDDGAWRAMRIPHMPEELSNEPPRSTKPVWLRQKVNLPKLGGDQRVVLQVTDGRSLKCWLNGRPVATRFSEPSTLLSDVTTLAVEGDNLLVVQSSLPGIQGYVRLHLLPLLHLGVRGLMVDFPGWTGGPAKVRVRTEVENHSPAETALELRATILDPDGKTLATARSQPLKLAAQRSQLATLESPAVADPPLWSPETPRLCRAVVELLDGTQVLGRREATFGFRRHRFEPDGPFVFNGKKYPVRGVVYVRPRCDKFPDRKSLWEYEVDLLKGMGVNFVRTADTVDHGFYEVCDRAGLFVTPPMKNEAFDDTTKNDTENTVREFYNHPSVVAWHTNGEGKDGRLARILSQTTQLLRTLDPERSVLCCELGWRSPGTVGLVDADIAGQGNYTGWYEGTLEHIGPYLDDYRALLKERYRRPLPVVVSNFGAAGDSQRHTATPLRNDYSHEYLTAYHQRFLAEIDQRPWLAGGFIFCWRDLQTEQPIPRHTWKGMLDLEDRKKDAYYFYQSRWTTRPMVHIAQSSWTERDLWPSGAQRQVEVFSNTDEVELFHDEASLGKKTAQNGRFVWDVAFHEGQNALRAVGITAQPVEVTSNVAVRFRPPAVEPRLLSQSSKGAAPQLRLTWNEIPGADRYTVYSGDKPDFDVAKATLVATVTGNSTPLVRTAEPRFYKVVSLAGAAAGPASYAVGKQPGSLQWKFMNAGWLLSSPTLADLNGDGQPEIVIGSYDGSVFALHNDGSPLWSFRTNDPVLASPAVAVLAPGETPSVVVNSQKTLYVLSSDGSLKWQRKGIRQFDRSVRSPSLADLDGDRKLEIIVGSDTGALMVFEADGKLRWQFSTAHGENQGLNPTTCVIVDLPDGASKGLCFATDDGTLYLLDALGKELWKHRLGVAGWAVGLPPNYRTPAAGPLHDPGAPVIIAGGGSLKAFDLSGRLFWDRADLSGFPQISDLFRDGDRQIVLAAGRTLHVVDHAGRDVWSYKLPHQRDYFSQPPACADLDADGEPDLVTGTRAAKLLALSSRGEVLWTYTSTDELTGVPAVADIDQDGVVDVVFGSRDGSLSVLSAGRAPPFAVESLTYREDAGRTALYAPARTSTVGPIESPAVARRLEDVEYGDDPLQKLDVYLPQAERPTPVIIEFHGGGWRRGHKRQNGLYLGLLEKALASGLAVVSANYRLTPRAVWPAQAEDAARVVQFVRAHAGEWNIDPKRVVLIGGSAGAHLSLWVGLHDDLADPHNSDPIRRQSTRVSGIIDCWGPAHLARLEMRGRTAEALPQLFGCTPADWNSPRIQALVRAASPATYVGPNDPPVLIIHTADEDPKLADDPNWKTANAHSTLFGVALKREIEAAGGRAELFVEPAGSQQPEWVNRALAFLREVFSR